MGRNPVAAHITASSQTRTCDKTKINVRSGAQLFLSDFLTGTGSATHMDRQRVSDPYHLHPVQSLLAYPHFRAVINRYANPPLLQCGCAASPCSGRHSASAGCKVDADLRGQMRTEAYSCCRPVCDSERFPLLNCPRLRSPGICGTITDHLRLWAHAASC